MKEEKRKKHSSDSAEHRSAQYVRPYVPFGSADVFTKGMDATEETKTGTRYLCSEVSQVDCNHSSASFSQLSSPSGSSRVRRASLQVGRGIERELRGRGRRRERERERYSDSNGEEQRFGLK
jgi:hypothetical protein